MDYLDNTDGYHDFDLIHPIKNFTGDTTIRHTFVNDNKALRINNEDLKSEIVDPIVNRVLNLIKKQFVVNEDAGMKTDAIIMTGGFSQSKYLQNRIKDIFGGVCDIIVPEEPINVFSRGAVEYALNPSDIPKKYKGPSISLEVQRPLKKYESIQSKYLLKGPNDMYHLKNRLQYFVKKGQQLSSTVYNQTVYVTYPKSAVFGN